MSSTTSNSDSTLQGYQSLMDYLNLRECQEGSSRYWSLHENKGGLCELRHSWYGSITPTRTFPLGSVPGDGTQENGPLTEQEHVMAKRSGSETSNTYSKIPTSYSQTLQELRYKNLVEESARLRKRVADLTRDVDNKMSHIRSLEEQEKGLKKEVQEYKNGWTVCRDAAEKAESRLEKANEVITSLRDLIKKARINNNANTDYLHRVYQESTEWLTTSR